MLRAQDGQMLIVVFFWDEAVAHVFSLYVVRMRAAYSGRERYRWHTRRCVWSRSPSEKKWRDARFSIPYGSSMVVCCLTPKAEGNTVPSDAAAGCARGFSSNWMTGDARLQASQFTTARAASSATGHCVLVRGH